MFVIPFLIHKQLHLSFKKQEHANLHLALLCSPHCICQFIINFVAANTSRFCFVPYMLFHNSSIHSQVLYAQIISTNANVFMHTLSNCYYFATASQQLPHHFTTKMPLAFGPKKCILSLYCRIPQHCKYANCTKSSSDIIRFPIQRQSRKGLIGFSLLKIIQ